MMLATTTRRRPPSGCLTFGDIHDDLGSDVGSDSDDEQYIRYQQSHSKARATTNSYSLSGYFQSQGAPARRAADKAGPSSSSASGIDSLADLELPDWVGDAAAPRKLVAALPAKHFNEKQRLQVQYEEQFYSWLFQLRQGFSLLFYGFGSKRALLDRFARDTMQDGGVLSINGLALGLTARQVLVKAASMVKRASERHFRSLSDDAVLHEIRSDCGGRCLYVLLHNIEGLSEQQQGGGGGGSQALLSELAACPNVHLVASMDHVNTPLLWDRPTASRFNWAWHDVTNYAPYAQETAQVPSLLVGRVEEKAVTGAAMVLRTVVPKAREVFKILALSQLEGGSGGGAAAQGDAGAAGGNGGGGSGLGFPALYREARDRFLVQNEVTLRSHLTEFRDHQLVVTRRGPDGSDVLMVPMDGEPLRQLLEEVELM